MRTPEEQDQNLNKGRFQPSSDRLRPAQGWILWLLVLLFPIPFSPWWLSITCLVVFGSLVYLLTRPKKA